MRWACLSLPSVKVAGMKLLVLVRDGEGCLAPGGGVARRSGAASGKKS